jgi:hypothetical protein
MLELLSTRRFMYANFCRESGYVQRYEGGARVVEKSSCGWRLQLAVRQERGKSEARAWLGSRRQERVRVQIHVRKLMS